MDESRAFPAHSAARRRPLSLRLAALGFGAAFLLGAAASWALISQGGFALGDLELQIGDTPTPAASAPIAGSPVPSPDATQPAAKVAQEARETAQRVDQMVEQTGGIDQRVAAMEQRIARLDLQSQAAAGNAGRAEGLLIAFAARRAIERGSPLGYLEDQLRLRFGDARPNAVQTIIAAAGHSVTPDELALRLEGIAPQLAQTPAEAGLISRAINGFSQLFVIRTDDTPSPKAEERLERARMFLESGRVDSAAAEVRNMPNTTVARSWLEDAERYAAAQRALEVLESTAVLDPRDLRDGAGQAVEQPSPAIRPT